ncbi:hypothetical protein AC249_AIPGENE403 [Exaiptasia diaphana]|nr:hypothetical protein AC249_AIPGENE403 [Exaiptasia diaphana]
MTPLPPALGAIIQLVICVCAKDKCKNNRCQCVKAGLNCTDLCKCCDDEEVCENLMSEETNDEDEKEMRVMGKD